MNTSQYELIEGEPVKSFKSDKPPYRVPSMVEIAAMPPCGLRVASLFAGCGGSSTGYRMAGFRVAWASEFAPHARESYAANKDARTILDGRDVREVAPEEILKATGLRAGELDVLDGSPPCQAFSTAGKRHKGWGEEKTYAHGAKQRNEDLFFEFVRILRGVRPRAFVAENVSGLVKGTAKGYFIEIMKALKASGYKVSCKVLDAQWLGVPQARQRTIFVGVREDLGVEPAHPRPLPHRYSVREALPWLSRVVVHDTTGKGGAEGFNSWSAGDVTAGPCPAVTIGVNSLNSSHFLVEPKMITCGNLRYTLAGRRPARSIGEPAPTVSTVPQDGLIVEPEAGDKIVSVRFADGFDGEAWLPPDRPYSTVGTSPASGCNLNANGGKIEVETSAGQIERRKFSIAELKRICAFPDDFALTGTYAQRWACLGNSVPPVMMFWIARTVRDAVLLGAPWPHDPPCLIAGVPGCG